MIVNNTETIVNSLYAQQTSPKKSSVKKPFAIKRFNVAELKQSFDSWKLVLVSMSNLIEWEGKFDPAIIVAVDTLVFGLLMFYNPSILSTISLIGISVLVVEILVPIVVNYLFKTAEWDSVSEAKFTNICERIAHVYEHYEKYKQKLQDIRKERQSLYFLVMFFLLTFCAYVGQCVNNFFLTYVIVLVVTLAPGARRHNLKEKLIGYVKHLLSMKKVQAKKGD